MKTSTASLPLPEEDHWRCAHDAFSQETVVHLNVTASARDVMTAFAPGIYPSSGPSMGDYCSEQPANRLGLGYLISLSEVTFLANLVSLFAAICFCVVIYPSSLGTCPSVVETSVCLEISPSSLAISPFVVVIFPYVVVIYPSSLAISVCLEFSPSSLVFSLSVVAIFPFVATSPSALETSPSAMETSPSVVETSPSALETSPSTLETSPSVVETSPSVLETSPSVLETSLSMVVISLSELSSPFYLKPLSWVTCSKVPSSAPLLHLHSVCPPHQVDWVTALEEKSWASTASGRAPPHSTPACPSHHTPQQWVCPYPGGECPHLKSSLQKLLPCHFPTEHTAHTHTGHTHTHTHTHKHTNTHARTHRHR